MTETKLVRKNFIIDFWRYPVPFYDLMAKVSLIILVFSIPLDEKLTRFFIGATLIFYILSGGFEERFKVLRKNPFFWVSILVYSVILLGTAYGGNSAKDMKFQLMSYSAILLPVIFLPLLQEVSWRRWAFYAFMLAMLVTLAASWLHLFWPFPWARASIEAASESHHIFKSHITQSVMMALFLLGCIVMAAQKKRKIEIICFLIFSCLATINIFIFVGGRTGYLATSFVLAIAIYFLLPVRIRYYSALFMISACVSLFSFSPLFKDRVTGIYDEIIIYKKTDNITSSGARLKYWEESIRLMQERPLLGFGTGSWVKEFCRISRSEKWCHAWSTVHPHNQFLHFGVQYGLLGVFALCIYFSVTIKMALQYSRLDKLFLLGMLGVLLMMSLVDVPFFIIDESRFFPAMLSLFFAGWAVGQHKKQGVFEADSAQSVTVYAHRH
jgi:O-antigen ligase